MCSLSVYFCIKLDAASGSNVCARVDGAHYKQSQNRNRFSGINPKSVHCIIRMKGETKVPEIKERIVEMFLFMFSLKRS